MCMFPDEAEHSSALCLLVSASHSIDQRMEMVRRQYSVEQEPLALVPVGQGLDLISGTYLCGGLREIISEPYFLFCKRK